MLFTILLKKSLPYRIKLYLAEFKLIQNPDETKKYLSNNLSLPAIEIIEKLEQEYKINISGISDQNEDLYTRFI